VGWTVLSPTWIALCDSDFERIATRCPELMRELVGRAMRTRSLAMSRALLQIPNLDDRLLVYLWQLADRWGRIQPGVGVVLDLQLTQATLGDLIGAQRQSISRAARSLMRRGLLSRDGGRFVLHGSPPEGVSGLESDRPRTEADPEPMLSASAAGGRRGEPSRKWS
jgi:CRP/FNR family cyclic AMP-dependent transcriptional regulator